MDSADSHLSGEDFIKTKILKSAIGDTLWGIVILAIAIILTYTVSFAIAGIIIGIFLFLSGIYQTINWKCHSIYKNWQAYGRDEQTIDIIRNIIAEEKHDFSCQDFLISKGWLIQPETFVFLKINDINWIYLYQTKIYGMKKMKQLKILTRSGLSKNIQLNATENKLKKYITILHSFCNNAYFGFHKKLQKLWKSDRENFAVKAKEMNLLK